MLLLKQKLCLPSTEASKQWRCIIIEKRSGQINQNYDETQKRDNHESEIVRAKEYRMLSHL